MTSFARLTSYGLLAVLGLLAAGRAFSGTTAAESDRDAKAEFLETFFYAQDRGIHEYPGIVDVYSEINGVQPWNGRSSEKIEESLRALFPMEMGLQVVDGRLVGIFRVQEPGYSVGVAGCVMCHAGKAAGVFVPGLGNKNVNLKEFASVGLEWPSKASFLFKGQAGQPGYETAKSGAERMEKILSDSRYVSPVDGLIETNIVPRTFFESFGQSYDDSADKHYLVKVPQLWGIEAKRSVGFFCDGGGDAAAPGWMVGPEIMWGQKAEVISSDPYLRKIHHVEGVLNKLLPPAYPFATNQTLVKKGAGIFEHKCEHCHGSYERDPDGLPIFRAPNLVPLSEVGTDSHRLGLFANVAFWQAAGKSPFKDLIKKGPEFSEKTPAYFAPRLEGIWSRFPYLHNGSVPTLWHMLHPAQRPTTFSMKDAGERYRFDEQKVGLTTDLEVLPTIGRHLYSTESEGQSSMGHSFGENLSEPDKLALIEYLKTL